MTAAGITRRHAWLYGLSAAAISSAPFPLRALAREKVECPTGNWELSRKLSRGLRDGNSIVVARSWQIAFTEQSRGIAISGEQVSVSVDAPPALEPLAKIEEERSTKGLFPILLAPDGTIVAAGANTSQASFDMAVKTAQTLLEERGLSKDSVQQQAAYMAQLQKAGSSLLDEAPGDLFFPSTIPFRDVRQVALPDGAVGAFEVTWQASVQTGTNLLELARREVITRIGESERRSSEEWSLVRV